MVHSTQGTASLAQLIHADEADVVLSLLPVAAKGAPTLPPAELRFACRVTPTLRVRSPPVAAPAPARAEPPPRRSLSSLAHFGRAAVRLGHGPGGARVDPP